jgi:hypothetical protein
VWPLVRESLRPYRTALLSAWAICTIAIAAVFAVLAVVGVASTRQAILWAASALPLYMLLASAIPGWIALGTDMTEHRMRLHLLLPISLREVALARLLLPTALLLLGLPLAHLLLFGVRLVTHNSWASHGLVDLVAAHLLLVQQACFAGKEVTVLRERSWERMALGWLAITVLANVDISTRMLPGPIAVQTVAVLGLAVLTAAASTALFMRRHELTR